jgi:hypothetical protein
MNLVGSRHIDSLYSLQVKPDADETPQRGIPAVIPPRCDIGTG